MPPSTAPIVIDRDSAPPAGQPCLSCGCPVEASDKFCPACGIANANFTIAEVKPPPPLTPPPAKPTPSPANSEVVSAEIVSATPENVKHFRCEQCGAEVLAEPQQRSYVCPFCDSNFVVEFTRHDSARHAPEFIVGFAITPEQAREKFRTWITQNAWFNPGDLSYASVEDKQRGVYLPFWSFPMLVESEWAAQIGEYWQRTEHYTTYENGKSVTRTRTVTETEWWPLAGRHHRFYSGHLVSGSRGLPQEQATSIMPFNLPALKRYEPYFLAGWLCEEYSVPRNEALVRAEHATQQQEEQNIRAFLPGDRSQGLHVQSRFSHISSDLCLLPVYILSYKYENKLYRFLVNGQTGKYNGEKPVSSTRITIAVVVGVALILILVFIIMSAMKQ
jgi:DNA-directed RNA polymerase subunit RPC12/RpoP